MAFRRLLVATDFSEFMPKILGIAKDLAAVHGAKIVFCTALEIPPENTLLGGALKPLIDVAEETRKAEERLKEAAEAHGLGNLVERYLVLHHLPGDEVPEAAAREGCDLIVVGTHGRSGFQHFVVGSVAERIVRRAKVPVLVVPK